VATEMQISINGGALTVAEKPNLGEKPAEILL
jgi:hypothetical protein